MRCKCYVRTLSQYQQFIIRYGAHNTDCPVYRTSKDPVDQLRDDSIRKHRGTNLTAQEMNFLGCHIPGAHPRTN